MQTKVVNGFVIFVVLVLDGGSPSRTTNWYIRRDQRYVPNNQLLVQQGIFFLLHIIRDVGVIL